MDLSHEALMCIGIVYCHISTSMLSLFIGAVTMSMTESLEDMKTEARKNSIVDQAKKRAMERMQTRKLTLAKAKDYNAR